MATFTFDLVSPEKLLFSGEVDQVDVPGLEGDFGVLAGHAPIVSALRPGIMTVYVGGQAERITAQEGKVKELESGNALDRAIERLDHFKQIDHHLQGTALH